MSIGALFQEVFTRPIFNALIFLAGVLPGHDLGLAIVLLTLLFRVLLAPLSQKAARSQAMLAKLQPEIQAIQKKHEGNREGQARALMEFYREKGINPASGCLPMLIQLPILLALYQAFLQGIDPGKVDGLYSFVSKPEALNTLFLGLFDLGKRNIPLAIIAGLAQFWQSWMLLPRSREGEIALGGGGAGMATMLSRQMAYVLPVITVIISLSLPGALPLYWLVTTLFSVAQQYIAQRSSVKSASA